MNTLLSEKERAESFGRALDALRDEVTADLGERDVAHLRRVTRTMHGLAVTGRALLHFGIGPVSFVLGSVALGVSKILDNMEIGHNIMHGQYDWTRDPKLDGKNWEWDTSCDGDHWRHSHNYEHHTYTNIVGKDRDVGYDLLRVSDVQPWRPAHLAQPIAAVLLALLFEFGVAVHDLHFREMLSGKMSKEERRRRALPFLRKAGFQLFKDYVFFPALALANAPRVLLGNLIANVIRNVWSFAIIFCGHFPDGVSMYSEEETRGETRGQWYVRQLRGSANIEGGSLFHVLSGHLSHQIEHHLFPDLPASRYPELAPRVRALAEAHGFSYNTGSFARQLGTVARCIVVKAFPPKQALRAAA